MERFKKHLLAVAAASLVIGLITMAVPSLVKVASAQPVIVPLDCKVVTKGGVATEICCREDPFEKQSICVEVPLISEPELAAQLPCDPETQSCPEGPVCEAVDEAVDAAADTADRAVPDAGVGEEIRDAASGASGCPPQEDTTDGGTAETD